jgi:hypothetical protein
MISRPKGDNIFVQVLASVLHQHNVSYSSFEVKYGSVDILHVYDQMHLVALVVGRRVTVFALPKREMRVVSVGGNGEVRCQ